jgi:hypothetical protein
MPRVYDAAALRHMRTAHLAARVVKTLDEYFAGTVFSTGALRIAVPSRRSATLQACCPAATDE